MTMENVSMDSLIANGLNNVSDYCLKIRDFFNLITEAWCEIGV